MEVLQSEDPYRRIDRSFTSHKTSFRDLAAHTTIRKFIEEVSPVLTEPAPPTWRSLPSGLPTRDTEIEPTQPTPIDKIVIIGAGVSGLYAAMILEDLEIPYEIIEASDRIGGRIYTHRFNGKVGKDADINDPARYDYFDVGAMRYPRIPFMKRVFKLFERLKIENLLIDYQMSDNNNHMYFNDRHSSIGVANSKDTTDPFEVALSEGGGVPDDYAKVPGDAVDHWTGLIYGPFKTMFAEIDKYTDPDKRHEVFRKAWEHLLEQDHLSTRGYMLTEYPESVVEWLESFDSATGLYNQAFTESVLDSLDFGWPFPCKATHAFEHDKEGSWACIDGGSDRMIDAMLEELKATPHTGRRVTRITETPNQEMRVDWVEGGSEKSGSYSQVICTAPLGCVASIDTKNANLLYGQKVAIRSLQYDASTKVGIKFAARWWEDPDFMQNKQFKGGSSKTDLPIRVCVYPSYGFDVSPDTPPPGVMIASYTWAQDAMRLGSLSQGKGKNPEADELLLETVLDNIARLHDIPREKLPKVEDHFAYSWYNDRFARGAFALFGPGQFGHKSQLEEKKDVPLSLFASIKAPAANGKLHFAGEATSIHHAWVLGSLNSAWRAIYNALDGHMEKQQELIDKWGIPDEETEKSLKSLKLLGGYGFL